MFLGLAQAPSDVLFGVDSPHFQVLPVDSALNRSEMSCLPETRSPEKESKPVRSFHPVPIENRLIQRSQASKRKLEEMRQRKKQIEAADIKDRPFVSQKSKELAANAEMKFWSHHTAVKASRPSTDNLVTLKERIKHVLSAQPSLAKRTKVSSATTTKRTPVGHRNQQPQDTRAHSRKSSAAGEPSYRSITPVPLRVAFDSGCDFARLRRVVRC